MVNSKATITDSASHTLGLTDLSDGGMIEISFAYAHKRKPAEVTVKSEGTTQVVFLPPDATILALMSYLDPDEFGPMSDIQLWSVLFNSTYSCLQRHFLGTASNHLVTASGEGLS